MKRIEMRFSGSGGQGLILAGIIMAEAAAVFEGKEAVQSQSYGPEARGGASMSEVIISDTPIDYPGTQSLDALLSLTQESADKFHGDLKPGGILLVDSEYVKKIPEGNYRVIKAPFINTAAEKVGKVLVANIVALGAMAQVTQAVSKEALEKAVLDRVPKGTEDLNRRALQAGFDLCTNC
jgi:2-oxoglutarate ferredoxin oxidoreductase subunit gamma